MPDDCRNAFCMPAFERIFPSTARMRTGKFSSLHSRPDLGRQRPQERRSIGPRSTRSRPRLLISFQILPLKLFFVYSSIA